MNLLQASNTQAFDGMNETKRFQQNLQQHQRFAHQRNHLPLRKTQTHFRQIALHQGLLKARYNLFNLEKYCEWYWYLSHPQWCNREIPNPVRAIQSLEKQIKRKVKSSS